MMKLFDCMKELQMFLVIICPHEQHLCLLVRPSYFSLHVFAIHDVNEERIIFYPLVKHNLSLVYNDIEQKDKAVELMTESLNIERQTLPEKHPSIAQC